MLDNRIKNIKPLLAPMGVGVLLGQLIYYLITKEIIGSTWFFLILGSILILVGVAYQEDYD